MIKHFFTFVFTIVYLGNSVNSLASVPTPRLLEERLQAGDPDAFKVVENSKSLDQLLKLLQQALTHQFKDRSKEVERTAIAAIRRIPGHATKLGDEIDVLSNQANSSRSREINYRLLAHIGSPEAIAQIGRFLFDERNPEKDIPPIELGYFVTPNSFWAAGALDIAMGDTLQLTPKPRRYSNAERKAWQDWWLSAAAEPYRAILENRPTNQVLLPPASAPPSSLAGGSHSQRLSYSTAPRFIWTLGVLILTAIVIYMVRKDRK